MEVFALSTYPDRSPSDVKLLAHASKPGLFSEITFTNSDSGVLQMEVSAPCRPGEGEFVHSWDPILLKVKTPRLPPNSPRYFRELTMRQESVAKWGAYYGEIKHPPVVLLSASQEVLEVTIENAGANVSSVFIDVLGKRRLATLLLEERKAIARSFTKLPGDTVLHLVFCKNARTATILDCPLLGGVSLLQMPARARRRLLRRLSPLKYPSFALEHLSLDDLALQAHQRGERLLMLPDGKEGMGPYLYASPSNHYTCRVLTNSTVCHEEGLVGYGLGMLVEESGEEVFVGELCLADESAKGEELELDQLIIVSAYSKLERNPESPYFRLESAKLISSNPIGHSHPSPYPEAG